MSNNQINLLQDRISELDSGILNLKEDTVELTGFLSPDRLVDYLKGVNCFFSFGIYPNSPYEESMSKDDAIFIVNKDDIEIKRWKYIKIYEGIAQLKINGLTMDRAIKIRRDSFGNKYQFIGNKENIVFRDYDEMEDYLFNTYEYRINISEN
jgi:hypothetical protein